MQKTLGGLSCDIGTRPRVMSIAIGQAPGFLLGTFAKREQTLHHFPVALVPEDKRTRNRSRRGPEPGSCSCPLSGLVFHPGLAGPGS